MEQTNYNSESKKWKQLTERDRYKLEGLFASGISTIEIAKIMGCSVRSIQREKKLGLVEQLIRTNKNIKENGGYETIYVYKADTAQLRHDMNVSNRGRSLKIGGDFKLVAHIEEKIGNEKWSPDAVIGDLKRNHKGEFSTMICTKTLYSYIDSGLFLNISNKDLSVKKNSKGKKHSKKSKIALKNIGGESIENRSEKVNNREEFGHWEIDLVVGKQGTKKVIMTLVERVSRKSIYVLAANKTQAAVLKAIKKAYKKYGGDFSEVFKTITADNGSEFLNGEGIKQASHCENVYYAHPYSSWERGSNENGNRILRRFVPKGTDIGKLTVKDVQKIEDWVNNYPRKILEYKTANERYNELMLTAA